MKKIKATLFVGIPLIVIAFLSNGVEGIIILTKALVSATLFGGAIWSVLYGLSLFFDD